MSSSGSSSPSPDKPAWFAARKQTPTGKSPQTNSGKRPPQKRLRRKPLIQVHPEDLEDKDLTLWQRIRRDSRHGIPGAIVSLVVHILVLVILALIVVQIQNADSDLFFDLGWTVEKVAAKRSESRGPVDVGAFMLNNDAPEKRQPLKLPDQQGGDGKDKDEDPSAGVAPVDVKNLLANRSLEKRKEILGQHGETVGTEKTIQNALLWLKRQQGKGGSWSLHEGYPDAGMRTMRTDTGATALALLAFLGAGHSHQFGEHLDAVKKGIDWLVKNQKPNGNFHDRYELGHQSTYYAHAQGVIVLCEAYAMTGDETLREPAQRGLTFLMESQNPSLGGWKYRPADELTVGDLSVTGWGLMALHTARAAGLDVSEDQFARASLFLDSVSEQNGTRYKYMPSDPPDRVTVAMTSEGLLCRQFLGAKRDQLAMEGGVNWILEDKHWPEWREGKRNVYEWYYTAQVLHNLNDEQWHEWFQTVAKEIVRAQKKSGSLKPGVDVRGSWDPLEPRGAYHEYAEQAGRLYLTAMSVLILETPYRHAPIYGE